MSKKSRKPVPAYDAIVKETTDNQLHVPVDVSRLYDPIFWSVVNDLGIPPTRHAIHLVVQAKPVTE